MEGGTLETVATLEDRARSAKLAGMAFLVLALACKDQGPGGTPRSFMMGFSAIPPALDTAKVVAGINLWSAHADAAILHESPPWEPLLNGVATPAQAVAAIQAPLVAYYRARGLRVVMTADPTDGLDRSAEHPDLVRLGRSITDTMVQRIYREWVVALAGLHPDYLGLAAETNLIRLLASAPVYLALKTMANAAVPAIRAASPVTRLYVSIQVEGAWARPNGPYAGIAADLADFPFVDAIGLSSYPYLGGFAKPEDIPLDYYQRIGSQASRPVLVVEGGWPSQGNGSSAAVQARYIARQVRLLDSASAVGVFQLTFFDLNGAVSGPPGNLGPFLYLGLADSAMTLKPALAVWDSAFARARLAP